MTTPLLSAAWQGLLLVLAWPNILYPVFGTLIAMVVALLPGLSGAALMALAIPLTFGWDPLHVMLLFGALLGGATFMGSVTAILLNIPGTAPNAATLIDGYPMARQGKARTALAASATASALGSTFGVIVLIALIPVVAGVVGRIGPAEYLLLAVWGLLAIGTIIRGSIAKGLAAAGLGLMVSFIGFDPRTADLRFTFGTLYLQDGLNVIPVFLGLFALAEAIDLSASDRVTISGRTQVEELGGSTKDGILSVFRNAGLFLRSSVIGTVVGMIPGLGGTVAAFVAYGEAARTDRAGTLGTGDIRGVIAPEAANDAKDGGSLLPTLALGIPASTGTAVLLGVMAIHGIRPGQEMMGQGLPVTFALIWALFLSNWLTSVVGLGVVRPLSRLTIVRTRRLIPPILVLATLGALAFRGRIADVWVAMVFGVAGYLMKKHHWSRVAFVMALVLGPLFELNLQLTLNLQRLDRIDFWARPSVLGLVAAIALTTIPTWARRRLRSETAPTAARSMEATVFTASLLAFTLVLLFATSGLHASSRTVPLAVGMPLVLLLGYRLVRELMGTRGGARIDAQAEGGAVTKRARPGSEASAIAWVIALPLASTILGFVAGPAAWVVAWARIRGVERTAVALAAGAGTAFIIYLMFGSLLGVDLPAGLPGLLR